MPDSPLIKFRQLLQLRLEHEEYGKILKPDRWDGGDPHEELPGIFNSRELFAVFVDTRRLEAILLDQNEINNNQLREQLPHLIRRARRRNLSQETRLIFRNIAIVSEAMMDAVTEYRRVYRPLFLQEAEAKQSAAASILATDRRTLVDNYIDEVYRRTGKRITRTQIWKEAGYSTRTEFERWQRQDPEGHTDSTRKIHGFIAEEATTPQVKPENTSPRKDTPACPSGFPPASFTYSKLSWTHWRSSGPYTLSGTSVETEVPFPAIAD